MDNEGLQEATKGRRPMSVTFVVGVTVAIFAGMALGTSVSIIIFVLSLRLIP